MDQLAERLAELEAKSALSGLCAMAKVIENLDPESKAIMDRVLLNPNVSTLSIFSELRNSGIKVDRHTIAAHRTGRCICPQEADND